MAHTRVLVNKLGDSITPIPRMHIHYQRDLVEVEYGLTAALVKERVDEDGDFHRTIVAVWGPVDEQDGKWTGKEGWIRLKKSPTSIS